MIDDPAVVIIFIWLTLNCDYYFLRTSTNCLDIKVGTKDTSGTVKVLNRK